MPGFCSEIALSPGARTGDLEALLVAPAALVRIRVRDYRLGSECGIANMGLPMRSATAGIQREALLTGSENVNCAIRLRDPNAGLPNAKRDCAIRMRDYQGIRLALISNGM